jgi:wobble nucleotide-excising tRNase
LPSIEERKKAFALLRTRCEAINTIIDTHNTYVDDFIRHQEDARMEIRRHFLSDGAKTYAASQREASDSEAAAETAKTELQKLLGHIEELKTKVREHGPAAALINKLVSSYLGHGELTISPIADGYELHRHGKRVRGSPSEGEKTAIALCYFLATLGSDGRKIKDLIVVVDDPVSSLDTKAMNYACALIRNRLKNASQLFVLTHNQHCMNEFKKAWKQLAEPKKPGIAPTARLLYLDVTVPVGTGLRSSAIVEMSRLHREYDSEYQFLFQKVLQFEASGATHSDYTFMMPNVIRRVLDVFMAFRIPRNGPVLDKIHTLCSQYGLDTERMIALERLAQVESHSDSLDDLISHSSMTIEEAQDANAALLTLMEAVDPEHLAGLRKYCKAD